MATINQVAMRWVANSSGQPRPITCKEASGQSYKVGQLVYLSSGLVTACADDAQSVFGIALEDASGTANTSQRVYALYPDDVLEANVYHGTAASAVTAEAQRGENYALEVDSNKCYVGIDDTSNVLMRVIDFCPLDAIGDQYGRVLVHIQGNYLQTGQAG